MEKNIYLYIAVMAGVSYLIRVLPLTLIRKPIKNQFIQSFLYYVPYVTLAVMTFPAILSATNSTAERTDRSRRSKGWQRRQTVRGSYCGTDRGVH